MKSPLAAICIASSLTFAALVPAQDSDKSFAPIFDGTSLDGWSAPDLSYWSIEDGAITATSSEAHPCDHNQFLVWQGGEIGDFELKLTFRIIGGQKANSGIQVRSEVEPDGHVMGYQVDIAHPSAPYLGGIYDEKGSRKMLASRGENVTISADGEQAKAELEGGAEAAIEGYVPGEWAEYHLRFVGDELTVKLNGRTTAVLKDSETAEQDLSGILALQLHSGPPMKVQFKDIQLKQFN